jgi:type IV pilus assembly protein PilF
MQLRERLGLLAAALLLAACASAPRSGNDASTTDERAAQLQVELGQQYMAKGDLETAQGKLQRALQLDPRSVDAHTLMAVLNERIGRPEVAEKYYRDALKIKPEDGALNNNLGAFLCGRGNFQESLELFEKAAADPFYRTPAVAFSNAGVCARKAGDLTASDGHFRRALELDPKSSTALYELARVSFERKEYMRARAFIQRYESLAPADAPMLLLASEVEQALGDRKRSQAYLDRLQREFPDFEAPAGAEPATPSQESGAP